MTTFDPGSILLAGTVATVAGSALLAGLGGREVHAAIGRGFAVDPPGAFGAGVLLQVSYGIAGAFAYAAVWAWTGLPIDPGYGAAFAAVQWAFGEIALGAAASIRRSARRPFAPRETLPLLLVYLAYGALLGLAYRPGS